MNLRMYISLLKDNDQTDESSIETELHTEKLEMKRGPGRPKKLKIGTPGRPRKIYS